MLTVDELETRQIHTIMGLVMDAVRKARSGHSGTAMALAPLAHVLWTRVMKYDAAEPEWRDRDRFVLSPGHASMLLYSMLYLTGHGLELDDLRQFRQLGSPTPGHPEAGHTPGVEMTTGPLGQGIANAVGMAMAERHLRARFGPALVDHRTYAIVSDGDLMEGISHEAASLAGNQELGRLTCIYDDNHITIDGPTEITLSDDAAARFAAYGWHVQNIGEMSRDLDTIERAISRAQEVEDAPSLIIMRSHIGWSFPHAVDTPQAHGAITDPDEIRAAKEFLGLDPDREFEVPEEVLSAYRHSGRRGAEHRRAWEERLEEWGGNRERYEACMKGRGLPGWEEDLPSFESGDSIATRKAMAASLGAVVPRVPALVTGSADLTGNTGVAIDDDRMSAKKPAGRLIAYGVREHAMGAMANGMARHGGVVPVVGTFLVFSDYMRGAVRLAALMGTKVLFVWSHDSIGVGEDGPTHQPVEHVASLRAIPGLTVIRPADANETARALEVAVEGDGPVALILSRQGLPVLQATAAEGNLARGAYAIVDPTGEPADVVLVGTGSEVHLCVEAARHLQSEGIAARVVSMPSWELFEAQEPDYRQSVLPPGTPTVSVEAGVSMGWDRYADIHVAVDRFGESAPGPEVMKYLGISTEAVVTATHRLLG